MRLFAVGLKASTPGDEARLRGLGSGRRLERMVASRLQERCRTATLRRMWAVVHMLAALLMRRARDYDLFCALNLFT